MIKDRWGCKRWELVKIGWDGVGFRRIHRGVWDGLWDGGGGGFEIGGEEIVWDRSA